MKRRALLLVLLTGAVLAPAWAQEGSEGGEAEPQTDAPPQTEVQERGTFAALDADGDGLLSVGEFGTGLFAMVAGDDQVLDPDEFTEVASRLGTAEQQPDFDTADVNGDGAVSDDQEFIPAVATPVFDSWDADEDAALSPEEYRAGWFGALDGDADGLVTAEEYAPYEGWFGRDFATAAGEATEGMTPDAFMRTE